MWGSIRVRRRPRLPRGDWPLLTVGQVGRLLVMPRREVVDLVDSGGLRSVCVPTEREPGRRLVPVMAVREWLSSIR